MPKLLLPLLIVIGVFPLAMPFDFSSKAPSFLASVRPLAVPIVEVTTTETGTTVAGAFANFCTTSSINEKKHYWLTAAHCVEGEGQKFYVMGEEVQVIVRDVGNDIAIVSTPQASLRGLPLAKKSPVLGDFVQLGGHPLGWPTISLITGTVMNLQVNPFPEKWPHEHMIVQSVVAPGASGSPVVNSRGEIVSVVQIGFAISSPYGEPTFGPVMGGSLFSSLEKYRGYWEM